MLPKININLGRWNRSILAFFSDTHGGHEGGMLNPDTVLWKEIKVEGGGIDLEPWTPILTSTQQMIWHLYEQHRASVIELAGKDEVIPIHNGDLTQGKKYMNGLVSNRMADQPLIAEYNMRPWFKYSNVKKMRLMACTGSHGFDDNSAAILVATLLSYKYPEHDIATRYHGLFDAGGLSVDVAHHGPPPGSRIWLRGNEVRYYTKDIMQRAVNEGTMPPDLVVRSHYHTPVEERVTMFYDFGRHTTVSILTPSYDMVTPYARQTVRSPSHVALGMAAVEVVDGKIIEIHWFYKTWDIRAREKLL